MDASKELELNIKAILRKVATDMSRDLKRQVPQRGQNPYATGNLKSKFNLDVRKNARNEYEILMTYPFYGNYTAYGTRPNDPWREQQALSIFDRNPFRGYTKGRNGIVPQNWLSLRQQKMQYEEMIQEELGESLEVFMNRLTTIGIRTL
jgi:hypothetical protein